MRRLWTDIIQRVQLPMLHMRLYGIRVDREEQARLLGETREDLAAQTDLVRGIASKHVGGAMPPLPTSPPCPAHPDFLGATPKNVRGKGRCEACVLIWETARDWRGSAAVKRAKKLAEFNPGSDDHLRWLLHETLGLPVLERTETTKQPSVKADVIERLVEHREVAEEHLPLLRALARLGHLEHRIGVDLNPPIDADGRTRPRYTLEGTAVGRPRSGVEKYDQDKGGGTAFNAFNIPVDARRIYIPDDGCLFVEIDMAQIQAALVWLLAGSERGIRAYAERRDIHSENAERIVAPYLLGLDWATLDAARRKEVRNDYTKGFTHASNFLEWYLNLARRFGVPAKVALAAQEAYFAEWPEIREWHNRVYEEVLRERMLRSPFGRVRRFLDVTSKRVKGEPTLILNRDQWKQALQFGPVSIESEIWKLNVRALYDAGITEITGIYDSHLLQAREDEVESAARRALEVCTEAVPELAPFNGGEAWTPRFEAKEGKNWGSREEREDAGGRVIEIRNDAGMWGMWKRKRKIGERLAGEEVTVG